MSNDNMFLWWGSGSAPCWKPMLVLAEKGLWKGCPNKLIQFSKKEHKGEEVTSLNPRGQVPTFKDGDLVVNESNAICMYIEEKYSKDTNRLLPTDVGKRAEVYWRMFESANLQSNIIAQLAYYFFQTKKEDRDDALIQERIKKAKEELTYWENTLKGKTNVYVVGEEFTMADVFVYPFIAFLVRMGATFSEFPSIKAYYENISKRPSVQETWPPHWKEGTTDPVLADL